MEKRIEFTWFSIDFFKKATYIFTLKPEKQWEEDTSGLMESSLQDDNGRLNFQMQDGRDLQNHLKLF